MPSGSGPTSASLSSVRASSGESCRLAGGQHPPHQDAVALHQQQPLHAQFPAVNRAAAGALAAAGRFGDAAVNGEFLQDQADDAVIAVPGDLLQPGEDPCPDPLVAAFPDSGSRAGAIRDRLIRAAEPRDLDQLFKDDPVSDPRLVAVQRMRGSTDRARGSSAANWSQRGSRDHEA